MAGEWTPPRWLDAVLRSQKFLVLGFLLFIILLAVPAAALPGYLAAAIAFRPVGLIRSPIMRMGNPAPK